MPVKPRAAAASGGEGEVLRVRALNRALLARQSLLERSVQSPLQMIERLIGLQAQAPNPPYLGLWTRLQEFSLDDLSQAMHERRIVRATMMRGTLHLVSADDYRALRPVLQPVLRRLSMQSAHAKALDGLDLATVRRAGADALREQPLSATALGAALSAHWPAHDSNELALLVRSVEPLVHVPPAGIWDSHKAASFATAQDWLGAAIAEEADDAAIEAMLLRYLGAFGPASARDASVWSGLTATRQHLQRLRPRLRVFRDEDGTELFDLPDAPRPHEDTPAPPRLLPEFDNVLLAHAQRARILPESRRASVFTRNGLVAATVLIDGFVGGVWKLQREAALATLTIAPFKRLSAADRAALETEAEDCLSVAAPEQTRREVRFAAVRK
ncbi:MULTISPECIES: winged helix DNA-binding domain-containing protein [unclassified Lysobacter]|uniref:winged helix DNA-binding domain-containing protein n=1 Tax=unclassified Lysobacter TaxID=2635362 RepID=UPI001BEC13BA|nr:MULTISPECIES: winged helix DNA-binding domain-containing protein [unclassified Lysobacter]MBT2745600.1 AlkZ family DNA glycosylase [Lysobacter sp. ISL-42]MBT2753539.1 AlkZ family DNA glycosylase [Lysobacter sp. ISL-50]MBT2777077.1 AlkZ family DNA glycosylase [Lysobacter sp. ISL-54]MBT2780297.1 AlkZ family DNA glycosylase [Lysobacter sp. ISL-52]